MLVLEEIQKETAEAVRGLLELADLKAKDIFVIGCSTSEVAGHKIGSFGSLEIAGAIFKTIQEILAEKNIFLAVQCCEHLNRSLVCEREVLDKYDFEEVSVVPKVNAGGSMASLAYTEFSNPVVLENIQARAGLDIGDTFIGMHLKNVAVPVRLAIKNIGQAHITMARTRPKYIGGSRAKYE